MRIHLTTWLLAAAGALSLPSMLAADDPNAEGVVRLGNAPWSASSADTQTTQQTSFHMTHGGCPSGACGSGYDCPSACGQGVCDPYGCGNCGYCGGAGCGHCGCKLGGFLHCLRNRPVGGCHVSPDHGWAPPGKFPRPRTAATYRRWFPPTWTGEGAYAESGYRYPMVYTPTDTTQLGYYHQRVPVWQRTPGMIPPTPHPDQFHVPDFGACRNGLCGGAACGYSNGYENGYVVNGAPAVEYAAPANSVPTESAPAAAPAEAPAVDKPVEPYVPPAPVIAPEAAPAAQNASPALEKSALAPFLYPTPQQR
ncbi:MAG: hypothetical protein KF861_09380 [Planctomycetaceae bacterium]|nr:hypothetical protein [Planctomycetaceae bacterium]